ncbi:transport protein particle component Bet3 domain containing protein [Entamoeba histolytica HM-1:IMSS-B]|uniref:Transport protein particle subunit trs31 n=7 Tax=Entamoeba TaxID=5758 RepID=C4M3M0_ENTH1|nr:transport protein particle component Bet3 domain containing protein [Entamoeba nuttalli P19]XP_654071.2 hypothetical protein EHI_110020 [Entamoeba histolytica HM-1:IMSS]EMD47738.1 transport protein particle subunit trs31, putative [Entamoeba histolytica KU27]EMH73986.1 transport protein particle component Bet3 domain containing protein [Entamoeba histolytica HM-1:IMSS-B]EMS17121.1 transport protein particle subunit trs31, putative [Entamoeba histolytica HM-3:IMSS]ENY65594.1 transport protei|eukprot:XP_008855859.1 transport protein particle component Bet3 domain containing protein [Entamoeba nuttalli P19]
MSKQKQITEKGIPKGTTQVSLSGFSFLFAEYVRREFRKDNKQTTTEFHEKLFDLGFNIGMRMLEVINIRERENERDINMDNVVGFIAKDMWRVMFGYGVDVGRVKGKTNEFLITDKNLIITEFMSYGNEKNIYCVAYVAGMAQACIDGADFKGNVNYGEDEDGPYLHIIFQQ